MSSGRRQRHTPDRSVAARTASTRERLDAEFARVLDEPLGDLQGFTEMAERLADGINSEARRLKLHDLRNTSELFTQLKPSSVSRAHLTMLENYLTPALQVVDRRRHALGEAALPAIGRALRGSKIPHGDNTDEELIEALEVIRGVQSSVSTHTYWVDAALARDLIADPLTGSALSQVRLRHDPCIIYPSQLLLVPRVDVDDPAERDMQNFV